MGHKSAVHTFGFKLEGQRTKPRVATNNTRFLTRLLDYQKGGLAVMISDTTPKEVASLKDFLRAENAAYQDRCSRRPRFAKLAKQHGLTNQEIADEYGITEAAVRGLIKRASR